jgi:hypothetical protein
MPKLSINTITDDDIRALQADALAAGDDHTEDLCRHALGITPLIAWNFSSHAARIRCVEAINFLQWARERGAQA